jgi:hypothetical protein
MKYRPYINWTKTAFNEHLKGLVNVHGLGKEFKALIELALLDSKTWDPTKDYDGCTLVQDMYHPCLSCFLHDYLMLAGQGGKDADKLFKFVMEAEGLKPGKIRRRWLAVRLYWLFWSKWKHLRKRNVNPYSEEFQAVLKYIENKK